MKLFTLFLVIKSPHSENIRDFLTRGLLSSNLLAFVLPNLVYLSMLFILAHTGANRGRIVSYLQIVDIFSFTKIRLLGDSDRCHIDAIEPTCCSCENCNIDTGQCWHPLQSCSNIVDVVSVSLTAFLHPQPDAIHRFEHYICLEGQRTLERESEEYLHDGWCDIWYLIEKISEIHLSWMLFLWFPECVYTCTNVHKDNGNVNSLHDNDKKQVYLRDDLGG